jgi:hypothetical protein
VEHARVEVAGEVEDARIVAASAIEGARAELATEVERLRLELAAAVQDALDMKLRRFMVEVRVAYGLTIVLGSWPWCWRHRGEGQDGK